MAGPSEDLGLKHRLEARRRAPSCPRARRQIVSRAQRLITNRGKDEERLASPRRETYLPIIAGIGYIGHWRLRDAIALPLGFEREPPIKPLILVSEDDHLQRVRAAAILTEAGYSVIQAADAREALTLLRENLAVAVLFTDVIMPGMNGFALADLALLRWPSLRVIFTTTPEKLRDVDHQPGLLSGIILLKPFGRQELITAVATTLARPVLRKSAGEAASAG
jgi:CheY-like chemotaxis protein